MRQPALWRVNDEVEASPPLREGDNVLQDDDVAKSIWELKDMISYGTAS